jgi:ribulose-bisphosphate carboxylase large chain
MQLIPLIRVFRVFRGLIAEFRMNERFRVHYRVAAEACDIERRAGALAIEQSVETPLGAIRDQRVMREVLGQVASIEPEGPGNYRVTLALALETTGYESGQLLNMLFGNSSLQPEVELLDLDLPPAALARLRGPTLGLAGLRRIAGASGRPLTACALKPLGSTVEYLAELAGTLAAAGIDILKDDHGLADQTSAPFARRVPAVQRAVDQANRATGGHTLYAPSLTGGPSRLLEQVRISRDWGVELAMLAPMISGLGTLQELTAAGLPILAHPAMAGTPRIASTLLLGKLFRLAGADAVIFPNYGGRFSYTPETCRAIAQAASEPWGNLAAAAPVPAGGMHPDRVEELVRFYGPDLVLLIGGALLESPDIGRVARSFVARVHSLGEVPTP